MLFRDRVQAGQILAERLIGYAGQPNLVVLALPRGGVVVGFEIAKALKAPFDIFLVRKIGMPQQSELAMGAVASGGIRLLNNELIKQYEIPKSLVESLTLEALAELERRTHLYLKDKQPLPLTGKNIILVDDGLATGATMFAAILSLKKMQCSSITVAVPVGAAETCLALQMHVDKIICLQQPEHFVSVGKWYQDFAQTTDDEVISLLQTVIH